MAHRHAHMSRIITAAAVSILEPEEFTNTFCIQYYLCGLVPLSFAEIAESVLLRTKKTFNSMKITKCK